MSYQQQQSNVLGRFLSDTASNVVSNVITTEIINASSGDGGGGGGGSTSGGSIFGGDSGSYNGGSVDNAGSSFWSPLQSTASDPILTGGDSGGGVGDWLLMSPE